MRILVVMPHYVGPKEDGDQSPVYSSNIEPLGRIAALNETIVALHTNFGPNRHTLERLDLTDNDTAQSRQVDIVIVTKRNCHLLSEIGIASSAYKVEFVDDRPSWLIFHAQRILKEQIGGYDFYCMMEDDLIIHDADFFEKLKWFQENFGFKALLAPVRFEVSSTGNLAKIVADPVLPETLYRRFRRPGQREEMAAQWHGRMHVFRLPTNPHAGSYFLTQEQLSYWIKQPKFDDRDESWVGPLESAATFSVGRVFDIYKAARPDPFFLEIQHFGARYAARNPPTGLTYGEPPLLAIAQNALQAAMDMSGNEGSHLKPQDRPSAIQQIQRWLAQGTMVANFAKIEALKFDLQVCRQESESLRGLLEEQRQDKNVSSELLQKQIRAMQQQFDALQCKYDDSTRQFTNEHTAESSRSRSLRWLLRALVAEMKQRWFSCTSDDAR